MNKKLKWLIVLVAESVLMFGFIFPFLSRYNEQTSSGNFVLLFLLIPASLYFIIGMYHVYVMDATSGLFLPKSAFYIFLTFFISSGIVLFSPLDQLYCIHRSSLGGEFFVGCVSIGFLIIDFFPAILGGTLGNAVALYIKSKRQKTTTIA